MSPSAPGVWIPLDHLLALPLPAEALATLWRHLLRDLPAEAGQRERQALEQALQAHELRRLEAECEAGAIETALSRLEGLASSLEPETLATVLTRLMPVLHQQLVVVAGPKPAPEVLKDPARAERLWLADQWMRELEKLPAAVSNRGQVIAEQLCRHATLAWMDRPDAPSRRRALSLLQRMLQLHPKARNWVVPAIRERLLQGMNELEQAGELADPQCLSPLVEACAALGADPDLPQQNRQALELAVFRCQATLDIWQNLNQFSFVAP